MDAKHTPGPWHLRKDAHVDVVGADGYVIADCGGVHVHENHNGDTHWATTPGAAREMSEQEEEANARLIAVAPELKAALLELLLTGSMDDAGAYARAVRAARAVLAKIEGRS